MRNGPTILVQKGGRATVGARGDRVLLAFEGGPQLLPWRKAESLGSALIAAARQAEEVERAEAVAYDAAILARAGAPFGLTNHPQIQAEAAKLAAWDSRLRRAMPGGVRSKEIMGTPAVTVAPPMETQR